MLTSEDVFKNTVLPSRIIGAGVNSLNSVHRTSGHTHHTSQTNAISEIEADMGSEMMQKPLQLKGGWVSRGISDIGVNNISCLQTDSATEISRHHHQQHRSQRPEKWPLRTVSDISQGGRVGPYRENSFQEFRNDVHHAATETYLITRLALTLLRYLGVGTRWMSKLVRLYLYALFLMPGFIQVGFNYYFSRYIHRSIVYGDEPRNR